MVGIVSKIEVIPSMVAVPTAVVAPGAGLQEIDGLTFVALIDGTTTIELL